MNPSLPSLQFHRRRLEILYWEMKRSFLSLSRSLLFLKRRSLCRREKWSKCKEYKTLGRTNEKGTSSIFAKATFNQVLETLIWALSWRTSSLPRFIVTKRTYPRSDFVKSFRSMNVPPEKLEIRRISFQNISFECSSQRDMSWADPLFWITAHVWHLFLFGLADSTQRSSHWRFFRSLSQESVRFFERGFTIVRWVHGRHQCED